MRQGCRGVTSPQDGESFEVMAGRWHGRDTKLASRKGANDEQIMEAIWVAAEMRAGGAYAHVAYALHALHSLHETVPEDDK